MNQDYENIELQIGKTYSYQELWEFINVHSGEPILFISKPGLQLFPYPINIYPSASPKGKTFLITKIESASIHPLGNIIQPNNFTLYYVEQK